MNQYIKHFLAAVVMAACMPLQLRAAVGDTISLDEKWLFKISRNDAQTPRDFFGKMFDDTQWRFQAIPGLWRVPTGYEKENYVGVYRGWIKLPTDFAKKRIMLHIGYTSTVADIYLNGEKIGTTAPDRSKTEFDITNLVHPGIRDLYVFRMNRCDHDGDERHMQGGAGIITSCYIYKLPLNQQPAADPEMPKAKSGVKVGDRYNVRVSDAFFDSHAEMQKDLDLLQKLGYNTLTYNKLTSEPAFVAYARSKGWEVVSDAPESRELLIDASGAYTNAAYALLPKTDFDFKTPVEKAYSDATNAVVRKVKPKMKGDALLRIYDRHYEVVIDVKTGLLASYTLHGKPIFTNIGFVRPNAKVTLESLTPTKPSKTDGTKLTAIYRVDGKGREIWTYNIATNGILTIDIEGNSDVLVTPAAAMSQVTYRAQDFGPDVFLSSIQQERPRVLWALMANASGKGVKVMLQEPFTAYQSPQPNQVLIHHEGKKAKLNFLMSN